MQFCKLYCMTWLSESLQTTKPASSLFQAWLEKPGPGPRSRQSPWQHYLHLVTARMKVCPTRGAWKWSLMRSLTDDVQSFWGTCDSAKDGPKASPRLHLRMPPTAWWTPVHLWRNPWHNPQTAGHKAAAAWWLILPCKGAGRSAVVKPAPNPSGAVRLQGKNLLVVKKPNTCGMRAGWTELRLCVTSLHKREQGAVRCKRWRATLFMSTAEQHVWQDWKLCLRIPVILRWHLRLPYEKCSSLNYLITLKMLNNVIICSPVQQT